jgi:hypothetical protein
MKETVPKTSDKGKEPTMEQLYTYGSLENILSWGDQPIPDPLEEVADLEFVAYNRCKQAIVKRSIKGKGRCR